MAMTPCEKCGYTFDPAAGKCPACTYEQAAALKERAVSFGDYETAAKLFLSAGEYKDAAEQAALCQTAAEDCNREAIYRQAVKRQGVDQASWQGKADLMRSIAGYRDADALAAEYQQKADELAAEAESTLRVKEEEQRQDANRANADHKRRRNILLLSIGTVAVILILVLTVSIVVMPSIQYRKAVALFDKADYTSAAEAFAAVAPYKESEEYLARSYYHLGQQAVRDGNDLAAVDNFTKAGTIEDAPVQLRDAKGRLYETASIALRDGDYAKAEEAFNAADNYEDAKTYKHFCRALRVWNGDPTAEADKLNLEKAADVIWAKIGDIYWYSYDNNREILAESATRSGSDPALLIENNTLLWELEGMSYTVQMQSLTEIRLVGSGPYAGLYERQ